MTMLLNAATILFIIAGLSFMTLGTVGLLRLPDVHSRLHALTKADNLGLGFIILAAAIQAESIAAAAKLVLIWMLVLLAATTASYLVAKEALRSQAGGIEEAPEQPG